MKKNKVMSFSRRSKVMVKKSAAWLLVSSMVVTVPAPFSSTVKVVDAEEKTQNEVGTKLTDNVEVQIGNSKTSMKLYGKGVYECAVDVAAGDTTAKLLVNGEEQAEETVSMKEAGKAYLRLADGKFFDSEDEGFVKSAALVGNFNGIEFVDSDNKRFDIAAWVPEDANGELDYVGGGIFKRTFTFKELAADLEVADTGYKVAANDSWDLSWGSGDGNISVTIPKGTKSLTVVADTIAGEVYDTVRSKDFTVKSAGKDYELTPFDDTVSIVGTIRGAGDKDWDNTATGYEYTQISENLYIYQGVYNKGSYEYKVVYKNQDWSDFDNVSVKIAEDNTNVIFVYDAKTDKLYDSVNNASEVAELLGMVSEPAKQEVIYNGNDTLKFVCAPESAKEVTMTYGVYDEAKKTVADQKTVSLTKKVNGSFETDMLSFGDKAAKVAYYYTVDGVRTLDSSNADKVKAGEEEFSVYAKAEFKGRQISLPGTVNGNGWNPAKESETMTYKGDGIYELTVKNLGAATYEYKVAVGGKWDENYGAAGEEHGANIKLSLSKTSDVTFTYNDYSHIVVNSIEYIFADIALSGTGVSEVKLEDKNLKGIYSAQVTLPAGEYKDLAYKYDGKTFAVSEFKLDAEKKVNFYFDPVTEVYYNDASDVKVDTSKIYFDSKDIEYKEPFGAVEQGKDVKFALQTGEDAKEVTLIVKGNEVKRVALTKGEVKDGKVTWSAKTSFGEIGAYEYFFVVSNGSSISVYSDDAEMDYGVGASTTLAEVMPYDLNVYKSGYKTPDWMKNAVIYQIFPDRFYNADKSNDKNDTVARGPVKYEFVNDWYTIPSNPEQQATEDPYPDNAYFGDDNWGNEIYGGDLKGIIERLGYLKAVGVNVIYLNPVFSSISNHRYDASDYETIDPILGTNGDFDKLVKAAKKNDMHIILDGVFNHVADDSKYFDRYYTYLKKGAEKIGAYPYWAYVYDEMAKDSSLTKDAAEKKAKEYFTDKYGIKDYTYVQWFDVKNEPMKSGDNEVKDTMGLRKGKAVYAYDCWWGYDNMPVIYSTNGSEYQTPGWAEEIIGTEEKESKTDGSITKFWLDKGSNGWRLDVANEVSDETWQHFRNSVKALSADNVIVGEIWTDASEYLRGDMYDSVMNYVFRDAVLAYVRDGDLKKCVSSLERIRERYPEEAFYAMMNLMGSHDTSRLLSVLDGVEDDRNQKDLEHAFPTYEKTSDRAKQLQYVVAFIQMTYAGAPTIYYGDELGMTAADDPDNRRAMLWGKGNKAILEWYATMADIRSKYTALRTGSVDVIDVAENVLAYIREDSEAKLAVMANATDKDINTEFNFAANGLNEASYTDLVNGKEYKVADGKAKIKIPAYRGCVLVATKDVKKISIDKKALAPGYDSKYIVKSGVVLNVNKKNVTIKKGKTLKLKVNFVAFDDRDKISYKSANKKVATVKNGKITAVGAGKTTITIKTKHGLKKTVKVTVTKKAKKK